MVLASASPRRAEILSSLGIPFRVDRPRVDEAILPGERAEEAALRLARGKAADALSRHPGKTVLSADTLVFLEDVIFGKPGDADDAARMLHRLAGKTHRVVTAVCLAGVPRPDARAETSAVQIAPLSPEEVSWYVATGEPMDKAGAYAVQGLGARFIEGIRGSYSNVVGLPARTVYKMLADAGLSELTLPPRAR